MVATICASFRLVVLAEASLLIGFVAAILVEARKFRVPPKHVWGVAASYIIIVCGYAFEIGRRLGDPVTYRVVVGGIAFAFGLWSMWEMYTHYRYIERVRRHAAAGDAAAQRMLEREMAKHRHL